MNSISGKVFWENPSSENLVFFDGRLDNRREIANSLSLHSQEISDSHLISLVYAKWGEECFSRLLGDFAIVIWDSRNESLFLARDPIGIKSLYYSASSSQLSFASDIQTFFEGSAFSQKINDRMVAQYLAGEFFDPGDTFYAAIRQVPPAHFVKIERGRLPQLFRYWDFRPQDLRVLKTTQDYLDAFHSIFKQAVHDCMQSPAPIGLLLSGGLDSTQVAAMAETLRLENPALPRLKSACVLVEGFLAEEKTSLDKLRERYGTETEILELPAGTSTFELFQEVGDTPHLDAYFTTSLLLERFQSQGCQVVLSGFGANELSNPFEFGYLEDLLLSFQFGKLRYELDRFSKCLHTRPKNLLHGLLNQTLIDNAPNFLRSGLRLLKKHRCDWMHEKYKALWSIAPSPRPRPFRHWAENKTWRALTEPLFGYGFNQMNQVARRFSLEPRFPFLDRRVIEFFLSVPASIKIEGGYRKNFIQRALAGVVPMPVRTEDDQNYFRPLLKPAERIELEIRQVRKHLLPSEAPVYTYVKRGAISNMIETACPGNVNLPFLWRLARLNAWLQSRVKTADIILI